MKGSFFSVAALVLLLSLALNACAGATPTPTTIAPQATSSAGSETTAKPGTPPAAASPSSKADTTSPQAPQYGGTIRLALTQDVSTFDDAIQGGPGGVPNSLTNQELWGGDWTKGSADGLGAKETDWGTLGYDIFGHKTGYLAESWKTDVDNQTGQAVITYKIRPGVRYSINPSSESSRQVGGREVTADDVLAAIKVATTNSRAYVFRSNPELRNIDVSKTGPLEITIKVPVANLVTALSRMGDSVRIYPTEVRTLDTADWKNLVGTGPFMLTEYVAGSSMTFTKNPNYWMKDPIGPGKGNQLPYVDGIQHLIIPDPSTRLAAFRTGKIDEIDNITWEDANQIKKEFPQMPAAQGGLYYGNGFAMYMRTDKAPYNDVRVRRALMMATDFNTIKQTINGGLGQIISFPYDNMKGYADLYPSIDDPDLPPSVKEQFVYSPDKAKALLAEAGYPNGFKTSIMITANEASYYEMIASMWAKVGVELAIDVKDAAVRTNAVNTQAYDHMTSGPGKAPTAIYYSGNGINGVPSALTNMSFVDDPFVKETLPKIRTLAGTDEKAAMKLAKQMAIRALDQAWAIQVPNYPTFTYWWPWLKNYSGEISVGYFNAANWTQFVWVDQPLKKSMGQ